MNVGAEISIDSAAQESWGLGAHKKAINSSGTQSYSLYGLVELRFYYFLVLHWLNYNELHISSKLQICGLRETRAKWKKQNKKESKTVRVDYVSKLNRMLSKNTCNERHLTNGQWFFTFCSRWKLP